VSAREVWLRVSTLPEGLRKALQTGNAEAALLCATQLLFGWHLQDARQRNPAVGTYIAWQAFVRQHPYASAVAPVSLGLCGNNPAVLEPLNDHYLPGQGTVEVFMSTEFRQSGWFAVDAQAEQAVLALSARQRHLSAPGDALHTPDDVLALAEQWLQQPRAPRPAARRARRLLRPPLRPDPRRAALHPRPRRRDGRGLPQRDLPRAQEKELRELWRVPHAKAGAGGVGCGRDKFWTVSAKAPNI
jgi:hypothetical protein